MLSTLILWMGFTSKYKLNFFSTITREGETLYPPNGDPVLTLTGWFSLLR